MLTILLSLAGCSSPASTGSASTVAAREVRLWQDASIFTLVGQLIGSAQRRVLVEMYELGRSEVVRALGAAEARGVEVRVITDPTVLASRRAVVQLDSLRVPERVYPVDDRRHQIDHVKLLIADGHALVAGMNWGATSARNHDYGLETWAPLEVGRLDAIFEQDWSLAGGMPKPLAAAPPGDPILQTAPGAEVLSALLDLIASARSEIRAEIFVLTDHEVLAALAAAHRRGVRVRVLLDPRQDVNQPGRKLLAAAGVEVRSYPAPPGAKLHAKTGLFDVRRLLLGSANWSLSGLTVNHELDVETTDPDAIRAYASRFESDWARAA